MKRGNNYSNLDKEEMKALIVIKRADKGSAVVWSTKDYKTEAYSQFGDSLVYELVEGNCLENLSKLVNDELKSLKIKAAITEKNPKIS